MAEYNKDAYIEKVQAREADLAAKLDAGMQGLLSNDKYKAYLETMSYFPRYSARNVMLIHQQKPEATRVAVYDVWKDKFNRYPRKGTAIWIYARTEEKVVQDRAKLDPETRQPILDGSGKPVTEQAEATVIKYPLVPVYDVSDTTGDPMPHLAEDFRATGADYDVALTALKAMSPLPISFEAMPPEYTGYCEPGGKIGIKEGMGKAKTIVTLAQMVANAHMHGQDSAHKSREIKELEAESVAYVICQRFGIETEARSFDYQIPWSGEDMNGLKQSMKAIQKESKALIVELEKHFREHTAEQERLASPDPSITAEERNAFGFTNDGFLPLRKEKAAELLAQGHVVYLLNKGNSFDIAGHVDEIQLHAVQGGLFGIGRMDWATQSDRSQQSLSPEQNNAEQSFTAWVAVTESSRHQWTEDEIYRLNGRGSMYYTGGEDGIYMRIQADGTLEAGNYEGAIPHIGDATFMPVVTNRYESYSLAFQAAMEAGGKRFMADMFSGSELQTTTKVPQEGTPSLRETLAKNAQKSKELFGDQSPTQSAPQLEETI